MLQLTDKQDCCGCHACASVCARHSINMQEDNEGFLYPVVDASTCSDCGLCEKVCPVINQDEPRKPLKVYAAKNRNEEVRIMSSSGGIFTPLAETVIRDGGVVFGAKFDKDWNVVHAWTDTIEGIANFRGSKYVQSTIGNTYREAREFLKQGRKVLFSGTPCQIAGLKKFLRKEYDNLLTVDVVCHGVPSLLVWREYLKEISKGKEILKIDFRDKKIGWKNYRVVVKGNDDIVDQPFNENIFMKGFLRNLYLRPSCYACTARSGKSGSDISIADFWGVQNYYPEFDDDKGIGLVLVNTEKGRISYGQLNACSIETTYEQGLAQNPCIERSVEKNKKYVKAFWTKFPFGVTNAVEDIIRNMRPSMIMRLYWRGRSFVKRIVSILG